MDALKGYNIVIVIPAYNEEPYIGSVLLLARKYAQTVIVVDDGSCDATAEVALEAGAKVIKHTENRGKAAALNTGLQASRAYHPDVVVMLDADGQHLPREIVSLVEPVLKREADLVVGSRYPNGTSKIPFSRTLGHRFFNHLTRLASSVDSNDSQSGYRAISPAALKCLEFRSQGFAVESEMQFLAKKHHLKVTEVPIHIRYLDRPKRLLVSQGLAVLKGVIMLTVRYRPLFCFAVLGIFFLLVGLALWLWVVLSHGKTR